MIYRPIAYVDIPDKNDKVRILRKLENKDKEGKHPGEQNYTRAAASAAVFSAAAAVAFSAASSASRCCFHFFLSSLACATASASLFANLDIFLAGAEMSPSTLVGAGSAVAAAAASPALGAAVCIKQTL